MGIVVEDERGAASGVNSAVWSLPNALSSFVGAYLMAMGFLVASFFLSGILYVISITLFCYFFRKTGLKIKQLIYRALGRFLSFLHGTLKSLRNYIINNNQVCNNMSRYFWQLVKLNLGGWATS